SPNPLTDSVVLRGTLSGRESEGARLEYADPGLSRQPRQRLFWLPANGGRPRCPPGGDFTRAAEHVPQADTRQRTPRAGTLRVEHPGRCRAVPDPADERDFPPQRRQPRSRVAARAGMALRGGISPFAPYAC